jgi:ssDNA thymidine ADP-ribosyltransferase, DarT
MTIPANPKIYHILHVDNLPSIIASEGLLSDAKMIQNGGAATAIGMNKIKQRRIEQLELESHSGLKVGQCVPFYFCPRSVMLYLFHQNNHPELTYRGGQGPIIHLESDLHRTVEWANQNGIRWAFTLSNAGSMYFEDRCDLSELNEINWQAVQARQWSSNRESKQAEFLIEDFFHWNLVDRIGVHSQAIATQVLNGLAPSVHKPSVEILQSWYY